MEGEGGEVGCVRDGCSEDFSLVGVVASYWIGCLCLCTCVFYKKQSSLPGDQTHRLRELLPTSLHEGREVLSSASHLGDGQAAVAWEPSGRAVTRPVPHPHRRPRAPAGRRDRLRSSSGLNGSPQVRDSPHRARAPPSRRSPRQAPSQRSATQLGKGGFQEFPSPARDTSCRSLHLKPARHASACGLLCASDA